MWTKQQSQAEPSAVSPAPPARSPVAPSNSPSPVRPDSPPSRGSARLGAGLQIKGEIVGVENFQIDGKVDGPISLPGHRLTIGSTAQLNSEIHAGEAIIFGKVVGNLYATDRVDIKKDGSIIGDISTARISIEDGAHFKGRIEIDPTKSRAVAD